MQRFRSLALLVLAVLSLPAFSSSAWAWGDEGHEIVGLIALAHLTPEARAKADALLAADTSDTLTASDFVARTTWADRWRDSDRNTTRIRYTATAQWHFVDIELTDANLDAACFGNPPLPPGTPASQGPARDCVVDKVEQFAAELADASQSQAERILALKFLLHLVGDLHQPLHAADNHDRGGNEVQVLYGAHRVATRLHAYWDTAVVQALGREPAAVARDLDAQFTLRRAEWEAGPPRAWAQDSFAVAREVAYHLPSSTEPDERGTPAYRLDGTYAAAATQAAREQLAKAGFRLAALLNRALP